MTILSKSKVASVITEDREAFKTSLARGEVVEKILISPFKYENLGPTSYDLSLGGDYVLLARKLKQKHFNRGQTVKIEPGETITLVSLEYIGLPFNIAGMVFSKVTWLEAGLSQISTYVHPGFHGQITETVVNLSARRVELDYGSPFCQIIFHEVPDAKSDERYTGSRSGQTGDVLKRLIERHNPRSTINGRIASFINMGLITSAVLVICAGLATQRAIWPQSIGLAVSMVLAAFFGGFLIEEIRRRVF